MPAHLGIVVPTHLRELIVEDPLACLKVEAAREDVCSDQNTRLGTRAVLQQTFTNTYLRKYRTHTVYIYITYTNAHIHTHIDICTIIYTYVHTHTDGCVLEHMYKHVYICTHIYTCTYTHAEADICSHTYIYAY